jgi:hypothetical protein
VGDPSRGEKGSSRVAAETATKEEKKAQFEVEGEKYDYPDPLDLDMDEWVIIYSETGLILEDFAPFDNKSYERERIKKLRNPALIKALAMCGYLRANRDEDVEEVRELIGNLNMLSVLEQLVPEVAEDAVDPPTSGPQSSEPKLPPSSGRSEDDSNGNTSPDSPKNSDEAEEIPVDPADTGTGE